MENAASIRMIIILLFYDISFQAFKWGWHLNQKWYPTHLSQWFTAAAHCRTKQIMVTKLYSKNCLQLLLPLYWLLFLSIFIPSSLLELQAQRAHNNNKDCPNINTVHKMQHNKMDIINQICSATTVALMIGRYTRCVINALFFFVYCIVFFPCGDFLP